MFPEAGGRRWTLGRSEAGGCSSDGLCPLHSIGDGWEPRVWGLGVRFEPLQGNCSDVCSKEENLMLPNHRSSGDRHLSRDSSLEF